MTTALDGRGRVVLPKELRDRFGLEPGCPVTIEADGDSIRLRRAITRHEALERLTGIIKGGPRSDPLDTKRIWEPKP